MKIPKVNKGVSIEISSACPSRSMYGVAHVAISVSAEVNGEKHRVVEVCPVAYLDQDGYGEYVFEKLERRIGRSVVRGE